MNEQDRRETARRELAALVAGQNHWAERFLAEMEFAEGLTALQARKPAGWGKRIEQAWDIVNEVLAAGKLDQLEQAIAKAEAVLAPIGQVAKTYTIHCVGHAHIDMNWMWSWPETVAVTNDTFITMLKLMDEFPDFTFTQSQASVYAIARDFNPELFAQIRRRVAEGRWEVAASHWVEGDKNLASGESLARHLLYTRRFMREHFGLTPEDVPIDWSPDTFGHAHSIPSIDSRGAVKFYYACRLGPINRKEVPLLWWQGPDGSRVLVNHESTWYNDHIAPHNAMDMLNFCRQTGLRDWLNVYGVGDHGGGPTRRDILRVRDMDAWPIYPRFVFSTAKRYFQTIAPQVQGKDLPVYDRELNFEFTGCYTSQSLIKKANRYAENYLVEAESAAVLAWAALGRDYPAGPLRQSWTDTLFSHFHDILPGSCVRATRDYCHGVFQQTAAVTGAIKTQSYRSLAAGIDTSFAGLPALPTVTPEQASQAIGGGAGRGTMFGGPTSAGHVTDGPRGVVVFNPTSWQRHEVITATVWDANTGISPGDLRSKSFIVHTPAGQTLPAQRLASGDYWGHNYVDLALPADVESLGYAAYVIEEGHAPAMAGEVKCTRAFRGGENQPEGFFALENELLEVRFDRLTGGIVKLLDKTTGRDLASPDQPVGILEYVLERPRGMSAWIIADPQRVVCPLELQSFDADLRGPYLATMVAKMKINDSPITVTYTLRAGEPLLHITVATQWVERGSGAIGTPSLRMRFPLALADASARYEIPFGSVHRDLAGGEEVPGLRWADVTGKPTGQGGKSRPSGLAGCAVLNDSKYGHSLEGSLLRLTLIRSSHDPDPLPEIGEHTIRMAIAPHGKPLPVAELVRLGAAFNHPLLPVSTDIHAGTLPSASSAMSVEPGNVILSAVKKAEDEDALIVRLFETDGKPATARVAISADLLGKATGVVETDLLERPIDKSTAKVSATGVSVSVPAHGIVSVKVKLAKK